VPAQRSPVDTAAAAVPPAAFPRRRVPGTGREWAARPRAERGTAANAWGVVCCVQCDAAFFDIMSNTFEGAAGRPGFGSAPGRAWCQCESGTDLDEDDE